MLLPLKLVLLGIGALYLFVAYQDWKKIFPFMLRIFGPKTAVNLGTGMSRVVMFVVGGLLTAISLIWIF